MLLQLRDVEKYYNDLLALNIPSLSIDKGIWWLQGDNGSGKTTFLKLLAGLYPYIGEIILNEGSTSCRIETAAYDDAVQECDATMLNDLHLPTS